MLSSRRTVLRTTSARLLRLAAALVAAMLVGALTVWAFLAYTHPDRVLDFAGFLQMCGIPIGR